MLFFAVLFGLLMLVAAWLTDGILRLVLLGILYFAEAELLTMLVRAKRKEPDRSKMTKEERIKAEDQWYIQRQDPAVMARMRPVGVVLHIVTVGVSLMNMIGVRPYTLWSLLGLACFAVCVLLCTLFPAYFSFSYMEKEKNRKMTFPIVNLLIPFMLSIGINTIRAFDQFCFTGGFQVLEGLLVTAAIVGLVLRLAVTEFRRHIGNWLGAMFFLLIFGFGIAAPLNHVLDFTPPETIEATVVEYHPGSGKNGPRYTFLLENREEVNLSANVGFSSRGYQVGEQTELEYHGGGFGLPYYCYPDQK
ncbi:MAG: hypothetical protein IJ422_03145 [Oscillospiraceae bacterium]|nr:hypothetical protein [Oscillospiraceae bacterium]MBQ9149124.1 hypothetical protein [Oscillospiraceae bacterium]